MEGLDFFFSCFTPIDKAVPITIGDFNKTPFTFDITIENAAISEPGRKNLIQFFGEIPLQVKPVENTQNVLLSLSRIRIPDNSYSVFSILKYIERHKSNGWFLGIGEFGPIFFDIKRLTHAQVYGSSGYGKSSFFRFLLSQTLSFQEDVMNFIIDPKQIDYRTFADHPRVASIATNRDEWFSLLTVLVNELAFREHVFGSAFSTPPASLDEYNQFKSQATSPQLPHFPRLLCWIDEAHLVQDPMNDELQGLLTVLMKKGRALGIHLILTTQRPSDISNSLKSQATTVFFFYTQESTSLGSLGWDLPQKDLTAIPGRLSAYDAIEGKFFTCQVPFINLNDSIGMSYGLGSTKTWPNRGIFPLELSESLLKDHRLAQLILKGNNISSLKNLSPAELETKQRIRTGLFNFQYQDFYKVIPVTEEKNQKPTAKSETNLSNENTGVDQLMRDFEQAIQAHKESAKETITEAPKKVLSQSETDALLAAVFDESADVSTKTQSLKLPTIDRINNTPSQQRLLEQFKKSYENSFEDFSWCTRDLSANRGLLKILKTKGRDSDKLEQMKLYLSDYALDEVSRRRLEKHLDEIQRNLQLRKKSPLLVISGYEGFGKKTLVEVLANELGIPWSKATGADLSLASGIDSKEKLLLSNDEKNQGHFINSSESNDIPDKNIVVLYDLEAALNYSRHGAYQNPVVFINTWKTGNDASFNKTDRDFKLLNEPHLHLQLTRDTYRPAKILSKLIESILKKHGYLGKAEDPEIAKSFTTVGVPLHPQNVDALVERAYKRALMSHQPFNWKVLDELISDLKIEQLSAQQTYRVILPSKTKEDLIVSPETMSGLEDVITKINNFGQKTFQFSERLRQSDRLVALFSGPPGTGKSMAAEVVANASNKELWVCDLGQLQSAFIGETEKILSEVFYTAQAQQSVLLLDEAEAFLTNRSQMKQDYSLKWVNHLLNLIESYKGILILTSNHPEAMDPAFARRIDIKTVFTEPNKEQSIRIIKRLLEPDAPLSPDIDFDRAMDGISISGGLLRNAIERLVLRMIRFGLNQIDTHLLKTVLTETQNEDQVIRQQEKQIGFHSH